ncbi:MAG: hypothetical protein AAB434_08345 [Planctomycetota bacterium]
MKKPNEVGMLVEMSTEESSRVVGGGYFQSFYEFYVSGTLRWDGTVCRPLGAVAPTVASQTTNVSTRIAETNALLK